MADIELVIKIPEEMYKWVDDVNKFFNYYGTSDFVNLIKNGTPLPKGHGRLKDVDHYIKMQWEHPDYSLMDDEPTIIEADKEYEVEIITRGNCMICGKELDEGLFFCKECEEKDRKVRAKNEIGS